MTLPDRIEALLKEHGPMTAREITEDLGASFGAVRARLGAMKRAKRGQRVFIAGWQRDDDGGRTYPRAKWAAGKQRDARKPAPLNTAEYNRRHRERKMKVVNNVFALSVPREHRRLTRLSSFDLLLSNPQPPIAEEHYIEIQRLFL